jgi:acyl-CoA synthetase (AMP-forming)/AMP-acid ligase II
MTPSASMLGPGHRGEAADVGDEREPAVGPDDAGGVGADARAVAAVVLPVDHVPGLGQRQRDVVVAPGMLAHPVSELDDRRRVDAEEVLCRVKERLSGSKVPKAVVIVDELPKTSTGKIQKNVLRDGYARYYDGP